LQTLPATKGRFRLNAELPIPFDNWGRMEVDLLCADARIAIELDGAHHLDSTEAYRRDRRKDQLLQENGYFVLRFLAEDVGKDLDMVLDTIKRALFSRRDPVWSQRMRNENRQQFRLRASLKRATEQPNIKPQCIRDLHLAKRLVVLRSRTAGT
jgi:hypothetical protein